MAASVGGSSNDSEGGGAVLYRQNYYPGLKWAVGSVDQVLGGQANDNCGPSIDEFYPDYYTTRWDYDSAAYHSDDYNAADAAPDAAVFAWEPYHIVAGDGSDGH